MVKALSRAGKSVTEQEVFFLMTAKGQGQSNFPKIFILSAAASMIAFVCAAPAYAYLDPGTGSMIVQAIAAAVLTAGAMVGVFWRSVKNFFRRLGGGPRGGPDQAGADKADSRPDRHDG
jgi:hypothetical protein